VTTAGFTMATSNSSGSARENAATITAGLMATVFALLFTVGWEVRQAIDASQNRSFPNMRGFSPGNLEYMRTLFTSAVDLFRQIL
jgi:hypothetical protein